MSPTAANAICVPSGDSTGRTRPRVLRGVVDVKSRTRGLYCGWITGMVAVNSMVCTGRPETDRRRILPSDTYKYSVGDAHEARNANTFSLPVTGLPSISKRVCCPEVT